MSFSAKVILASLAVCVVGASAGDCPSVNVEQNFDLQKFSGRWYQYSTYSSMEPGKCAYHEYTDNGNGTLGFSAFTYLPKKNKDMTIYGLIYPASEATDGKLLITYFHYGDVARNYYVLGTDYKNYAIVWSCRKDGSDARQSSWIMTRKRVPSASVVESANAVVDQNRIAKQYVLTDQSNCD
ncbi:apolipoprotein D-like [Neocloeon triangulifer]|uniref:apolipoprotein D-like n=1 Tax=Neocloeon triangulifer TaxID=2078957 RepID=UPI00286F29DC|nr:apolipoprotein D-like [Neocloeon triangulifer]